MNKTERQREHFNSIAEKYKAGREEINHRIVKDIIWKRIISTFSDEIPDDYKLLEAMCGYAEGYDIVSTHLGKVPKYYLGFDYSDNIIEYLSKTRPELNVFHRDAITYIPEESSYDIVFLAGGLHHAPEQAERIVKQLSVGLKPGGVFINFEPTHANPFYKFIRDYIYKKNVIFDDKTERAFEINELKSFFENANLTAISIQNAGLLAYILYYNPYAFPFLNKGNETLVKFFSAIDSLFINNKFGEFFSFATVSAWQKKYKGE